MHTERGKDRTVARMIRKKWQSGSAAGFLRGPVSFSEVSGGTGTPLAASVTHTLRSRKNTATELAMVELHQSEEKYMIHRLRHIRNVKSHWIQTTETYRGTMSLTVTRSP